LEFPITYFLPATRASEEVTNEYVPPVVGTELLEEPLEALDEVEEDEADEEEEEEDDEEAEEDDESLEALEAEEDDGVPPLSVKTILQMLKRAFATPVKLKPVEGVAPELERVKM